MVVLVSLNNIQERVMRQKIVKELRRMVYGDMAHAGRKYIRDKKTGMIMNHPTSKRAVFQKMKRRFLDDRRAGLV